jgi:TonB family protein
MRLVPYVSIRIAAIILAGCWSAAPVFPQELSTNAAAAKIAEGIVHAKQHTVMVFDFCGPDRKISALGQRLASQISAELSVSGAKIDVQDRSKIPDAVKANSYPADFVNWGELARAFAQDIHVQAFVMGALTVQDEKLHAVVTAYRSDKGTSIGSAEIDLPMSAQDRRMLDANVVRWTESPDASQTQYPDSGKNGYGTPSCLFCPRADYTTKALNRKLKGFVELSAVIGEDGKAGDIQVLRPLPDGLSDEAIRAVRKWRLKPAIGPNGQPVAVRQTIEVGFDLY